MAVQETKWISVSYASVYGNVVSGYSESAFGDISDTQGGTTDNTIDGVGSGLTVTYCAYQSTGGGVRLTINGSSAPAADVFDTMEIQNSSSSTIATLSASAASSTTSGTTRTWQWTSTNHFGTTTGADRKIIFDDGVSGPAAPTDIAFGADPGTASSTVSISATASGGGTGTLQVSEDNSNWDTNGTSYTFTRGVSKTIYARVNASPDPSSSYSEALQLSYLVPDTTITTISDTTIDNVDTTFDITIANGGSTTVYEVWSTSYGGTLEGSRTGNGTLTVSDAPTDDSTKTYYLTGRIPTASGGDNLTDNIQTFVITAADIIPITNVTLDDIHVIIGGTTGTTVTLNDADVRAISNTNSTYDGGDGINQTSATQVSMGEFRGAYNVTTTETTVTVTEGYSNPLGFLDLYGFNDISPDSAGSVSPTTYKGYTISGLYYLTDQSTLNTFSLRLENTGNGSFPPSDTITSITTDVDGGTLQLDAVDASITTDGTEQRLWVWTLTGGDITNVANQWDASGTSDVVITDA